MKTQEPATYDFHLALRQANDEGPAATEPFQATWDAAADVARDMLPALCERAGIPADPDWVYGQICVTDDQGPYAVDCVFLPGATVIDFQE